jgi:hypothetical protein
MPVLYRNNICRVTPLGIVSAGLVFVLLLVLLVLQIAYLTNVDQERRTTWDFKLSNLQKHFYAPCPLAPLPQSCQLPKIFILSGRAEIELDPVNAESWRSLEPTVKNTSALGQELNVVLGCQNTSWENRLFEIYRVVFQEVLAGAPEDAGFVFAEDDVKLINANALATHVCWWSSRRRGVEGRTFYSLFRPESQPGADCWYVWGTQAFYASREFMEAIVQLSYRTSCRMPIDRYIASIGPWYVPQTSIVEHNSRFGRTRYLGRP